MAKLLPSLRRLLVLLALGGPSLAQTGVLDQVSPYGSGPPVTTFLDLDPIGTRWQQEVRAGLSGQLEGVQLSLNGPAGAQANFSLRLGGGWNNSAPVFTRLLTKGSAASEQVFVDCSAAGIMQVPGTLFVIELGGDGSGCEVFGTRLQGPAAMYPRFLFRNGPGCYADCGTRIAFRTFVIGIPPAGIYCVSKTNSLGCSPSISSSGAPSTSASSGFMIRAQQVRNNKSGLLFYGTTGRSALPFQGGTLCVDAPLKRSVVLGAGGTPAPGNDCSGIYAIDMNAFAQGLLGGSPSALLLTPGTQVNTQFWGRDPGFPAPFDTTLSDGFEYSVP